MIDDEVAVANQKLWEDEVRKECGYTIPWLDLDISTLHQYIDGEHEFVPDSFTCMYPASILAGVAGKDVLCLASGGGQQSACLVSLVRELLSWIWPRGSLRGIGKQPHTMGTM